MSPTPEFPRPIRVADLEPGTTVEEISADEGERAELVRRFDLSALESLTARLTLRPVAGAAQVFVTGRLEAVVVQTCVVTLEPLRSHISAEFYCSFAAEAALGDDSDELDIKWDEDDPPEPIVGGQIDLGELVAERLGLEIDPFPRTPGAEFKGFSTGEERNGASESANPFKVLESIRLKKG